jgi:hypothetical protein
MTASQTPLALSLSKGCPFFLPAEEGQGFGKPSPNGEQQVQN